MAEMNQENVKKCLAQLKRFQNEAADLAFRIERFNDDAQVPEGVEEFDTLDDAAMQCRGASETLEGLIEEIKEFCVEDEDDT